MRLRVFAGLSLFLLSLQAQSLPEKVNFAKEILPVLTEKCMSCHMGNEAQAGLKAHTREDLVRGGKTGPSIVPGQGKESLLVLKMQGAHGLRMPPSGPRIEAATIDRFRLWIDQGAVFEGSGPAGARVARLAPRTPAVPDGEASNPIDRFVIVKDAKLAGDSRFARRAWLDITGLLPTPEELAAFDGKREQLVDTLLKNRKAYAEHWISFWNDLLRNDEGVIYHGERKSITEWLLASLQSNMPYDVMVRQLLDPAPQSGAEGFLTGVSWRGVVSASQTPPMQAAQNAAQVFLGINMKCAGCHDSFINRWKLADTYGLASMFSEEPLELVRCDVKLGKMAEAKFPYPELNVRFENTLASKRKAASEWFAHRENGRFARTLVNRYWSKLLGRGIVEPVDDMDAEPWSEDLLDWLASDFAAHGYDLNHLLRQIMTSKAYQLEAVEAEADGKRFVFRGPLVRRLSAEQFSDALSAATGEWRVNSRRTEAHTNYVREWRLKSDPLSRALGRPIRDQVYTERSADATTLQALELTNGPLLSRRLERGAKALIGELPPTPSNVFDSKLVRSGSVPVDVDVTGAKELWLLVEDVDSYDPSRVKTAWGNAELTGPDGTVKLESLPTKATGVWDLRGKGFTRFRAQASIDEKSRASDIGPALRFFVFTEKPDPDRLIRVQGERPLPPPPKTEWTAAELTTRLYRHLLARDPNAKEQETAEALLGGRGVTASGVEDLLWAMLMSPEFQYIY